jgi:hypothetical protein
VSVCRAFLFFTCLISLDWNGRGVRPQAKAGKEEKGVPAAPEGRTN